MVGWPTPADIQRAPPYIYLRKITTCLYLNYVRVVMLHAQHRLMQQILRQEFYKHKQKMRTQIMAALAPERCDFALPFTITGVDFLGLFK